MRLLHDLSVNSTFNEPSVTSTVGHLTHCCAMRTKTLCYFCTAGALQCRPKSQQSNSGQTIVSSIEMTSSKVRICFYMSGWCSLHSTSDWTSNLDLQAFTDTSSKVFRSSACDIKNEEPLAQSPSANYGTCFYEWHLAEWHLQLWHSQF